MRTGRLHPGWTLIFVAIFLAACAHTGAGPALSSVEGHLSQGVLKAGEQSVIILEVRLTPGGHFSDGSPIAASLRTVNLGVDRTELTRNDAVVRKDRVRFEIPVRPVETGSASLDAELTFYVCTESSCIKEKRHVNVELAVK